LVCNSQITNHVKRHNGMRPLDIVVLLKIIALEQTDWLKKDLAEWLQISASEVSESLNRSEIAGLVDGTHRSVMRRSLLEFLQFGLRYVFPQQPGALVVGMPTAHSAPY
jgi:predicted transcriptional regulator